MRLGEQILNSRVMLGREKTQLSFDLRWKVASDVAFPFPSRPKMKSPGFGRRGKIGWRLLSHPCCASQPLAARR